MKDSSIVSPILMLHDKRLKLKKKRPSKVCKGKRSLENKYMHEIRLPNPSFWSFWIIASSTFVNRMHFFLIFKEASARFMKQCHEKCIFKCLVCAGMSRACQNRYILVLWLHYKLLNNLVAWAVHLIKTRVSDWMHTSSVCNAIKGSYKLH